MNESFIYQTLTGGRVAIKGRTNDESRVHDVINSKTDVGENEHHQ